MAVSFFVFMPLRRQCGKLILSGLPFPTGYWNMSAEPGTWKLSVQALCLLTVQPARQALVRQPMDLRELAHGDMAAVC